MFGYASVCLFVTVNENSGFSDEEITLSLIETSLQQPSVPIDEVRLLERSMSERLLGLLSTERLASDMSAVTRVIATLTHKHTPR